MTITEEAAAPLTVHDALARSLALLSRPGGWARGAAVRPTYRTYDQNPKTIPAIAYAFCATAAVDVVLGLRDHRGQATDAFFTNPSLDLRREALSAVIQCLPPEYQRREQRDFHDTRAIVEKFNDAQDEVGPVLAAFRCAVDNTAPPEPPRLPLWKRLLRRTS